jgi:hypothetical protein
MQGSLREAPAVVLLMLWRREQFVVLIRVLLRALDRALDKWCHHLHVCRATGGSAQIKNNTLYASTYSLEKNGTTDVEINQV